MFFQVTFLHQPGQQFQHCFLTSNRKYILYLSNNYVMADVSKQNLIYMYLYFMHSLTYTLHQ